MLKYTDYYDSCILTISARITRYSGIISVPLTVISVIKDHPGGKHHHERQPEIEEEVVEDGFGY
jgi:hypothetical protein